MVIHAGSVDRDHIHLLLSILRTLLISWLVQYLKGRNSHKLLSEFGILQNYYWGRHLWATLVASRSRPPVLQSAEHDHDVVAVLVTAPV